MRRFYYCISILLVAVTSQLVAGMRSEAAQSSSGKPVVAEASAVRIGLSSDIGMVRTANRGFILWAARWVPAQVPVCWEATPAAQQQERDWVRQAVEASWQAHARIRFFGWGTCGPAAVGIRIAVNEGGPHTKGLGNQINGVNAGMALNFSFSSWSPSCQSADLRKLCIQSIGVHEFGHAIGFAHEQNRPDTQGECALLAQGSNGNVMLTPWDPNSVMNYCNSVYNNNGVLSKGDIASVRAAYP